SLTQPPDEGEADEQRHETADEPHEDTRQRKRGPDENDGSPGSEAIDPPADERKTERPDEGPGRVGGGHRGAAETEILDDEVEEHRHTRGLTGNRHPRPD